MGGGVSFTNNPGYPAVPGTIDDSNKNNSADENMGEIPNYRAVADAQSFAYNVSAGVDRYFNIKRVPNLMWYTGKAHPKRMPLLLLFIEHLWRYPLTIADSTLDRGA
ncbi:hypothetical protein BACFRA24663_09895 [Bacteroides fragilis]